VFIVASVYFVIDSVQKLLDAPSHVIVYDQGCRSYCSLLDIWCSSLHGVAV